MIVHKGLLSKEAAEEIFNIESVYLDRGNVIPCYRVAEMFGNWIEEYAKTRLKDGGDCNVSDGELRETQMTNYFSNLYPIDCAVLSVNAQSYRKYGTLPEHEFLPEI